MHWPAQLGIGPVNATRSWRSTRELPLFLFGTGGFRSECDSPAVRPFRRMVRDDNGRGPFLAKKLYADSSADDGKRYRLLFGNPVQSDEEANVTHDF